MPIRRLAQAGLIGCVAALALLAWTPAQAMTRTNLGGHAEHFLAYLGTTMVMGLASRTTPRLGP
jgi:O-antigen ligase